MVSRTRWQLDELDPRAPSSEAWAAMSAEERQAVADALPSEIEAAPPPEGDHHARPKARARATLERYFARARRKAYVGSELPVYYPAEKMFAPDVFAVLDVEPHDRERWLVDHEQRGLDWVLEILVSGSRKKDLDENVERYARLAIPEYFVFDRKRRAIRGFALVSGRYQPILAQAGRFASTILGLELEVVDGRLQFFQGDGPLPDADELVARLERACDTLHERAEEESRRAEEESRRAEEESRRAEEESRRAEEESRRADEEAQKRKELEDRLRAAEELVARLRRGE